MGNYAQKFYWGKSLFCPGVIVFKAELSGTREGKGGLFVISNQILQTTLDGLKAISRVDLCVLDTEGIMLATTFPEAEEFQSSVLAFAESPADSQVVS